MDGSDADCKGMPVEGLQNSYVSHHKVENNVVIMVTKPYSVGPIVCPVRPLSSLLLDGWHRIRTCSLEH
jgi:hypothetical protein